MNALIPLQWVADEEKEHGPAIAGEKHDDGSCTVLFEDGYKTRRSDDGNEVEDTTDYAAQDNMDREGSEDEKPVLRATPANFDEVYGRQQALSYASQISTDIDGLLSNAERITAFLRDGSTGVTPTQTADPA